MLTELMSFDLNDGVEPGNKGPLLCKLLRVPKAFTAQVLRAAACAQGLMTLDHCRQLMCSAFQKLLEREALLQHIHIKQAAGVWHFSAALMFCMPAASCSCAQLPQVHRLTLTSCAWAACLLWWQ